MKKTLALILALTLVFALAAPAAFADGAIKIGGTGPLTGGAAIYGMAVKNAAEIAVEEINAKGGIQFELRFEDDTHDAEKAVNAYNTLKDWGMQISTGSVTSKPCEATSAETYADRIFALTPSASSVATVTGKDNQFQMCFTDPNQGSASAQYIADKKLATKVAVIWKNDDVYSKGIYETFMAAAPGLGLEVVSDTTFNDGNATDFSVQIADAQSKGAELVFLPMYYDAASLILTQASAAGYAPIWFGVDGMDGILSLEGFDTSLAEGVYLLTPFNADSDDEATKAFVAKYQEKFGEIPNQFAADAYDVIYAYAQACEAAGVTPDMSAEQICDAMIKQFTTMTFNGLTGEGMTWGADGTVTKSPKGMIIENGAYVGID
ncbi:MAG: ABC transporter substrate-binding protein [Oscillospiraceae bacterium]|nr:ABC transporter substrate-binding protein [Oscillospiraceae bacterium]